MNGSLPLVLASGSPRRKVMLERLGLPLRVQAADVEEHAILGERPFAMAERLAAIKAQAVAQLQSEPALVLAADTIVVRDREVLGKPVDVADAARMLRSLSGRQHVVITGYALVRTDTGAERVNHVATVVHFRELTDDTIARYIATGEPMDKAGAYGIQGIGAMLVRGIEGSYTNVVGLPLVEVLEALPQLGGARF